MQNTHLQQFIKEKPSCFDISKGFPASFTESAQMDLKFTNHFCCHECHFANRFLPPNTAFYYLSANLTCTMRLALKLGDLQGYF